MGVSRHDPRVWDFYGGKERKVSLNLIDLSDLADSDRLSTRRNKI